jgi:benzodiazapine receptor
VSIETVPTGTSPTRSASLKLAPTRSKHRSTGSLILGLAGFLLLCFGVAALGAYSAHHSVKTWYPTLVKPHFAPPTWVFAPVWTVLYATMAVCAWLIWKTPRRRARSGSLRSAKDTQGAARVDALAIFYVQLFLNLIWTPIFFQSHRLLVSAVVIMALWLAIVATIILFWRVRALAAALLLPYLGWVTFATALNLALLRRN